MKMKTLLPSWLLFVAVICSAQTSTQEPIPQFTATEQIAIRSLADRWRELKQEAQAISVDVAAQHPGFHLDLNTLQLVPNSKPQSKAEPEKLTKQ
jgi:hypothetical protein